MRRIHFTAKPIAALDGRQFSQGLAPRMKPYGLWYSVEGNGDGWSDWCKSEDFRLEFLQCAHAVALDLDRVLIIRDGAGLQAFHARFYHRGEHRYCDDICWADVADEYAGIEIAPYLWDFRLREGFSWYYSWDCASGCIWDLSAIEEFRFVERPELVESTA